jgi:hypothetical protein
MWLELAELVSPNRNERVKVRCEAGVYVCEGWILGVQTVRREYKSSCAAINRRNAFAAADMVSRGIVPPRNDGIEARSAA